MKPIIILPVGAMSAENIKLLNDNDLCVVECEDPAKVKFVSSEPTEAELLAKEQASAKIEEARRIGREQALAEAAAKRAQAAKTKGDAS